MSNVDTYDDEPLLPEDDLEPVADASTDDDLPPDDGEDDGGALPQAGDPTDQPRQPSRRDRRIQQLREEARAATERASAAERAAELALRSITGNQSAAATADAQRQRAERLANMSLEERIEFIAAEERAAARSEIDGLRAQMQDSADRTEFAVYCASNPTAQRLRDQVETMLADERRQGRNYGRMGILRLILGERVLKQTPRAAQRQRANGAAAVARQTTRPGSPRSDAAGGNARLSEREARRARLAKEVF